MNWVFDEVDIEELGRKSAAVLEEEHTRHTIQRSLGSFPSWARGGIDLYDWQFWLRGRGLEQTDDEVDDIQNETQDGR